MRGKLLNPFVAEIAQLDTLATAGDPDGAGALTSGYDDDFRELVKVPPLTGQGPGAEERVEKTVRVQCQVEVVTYDQLVQFFPGNSPQAMLTLVLHFADLELAGMVDTATGEALLRVGDRLVAIYDTCGALVQQVREPMFCTQVMPTSFGLGRARNLLLMTFQTRDQAARAWVAG
jgi:hypothetical protein